MQSLHHIFLKNLFPKPVAKSSKRPCQIVIYWELKGQQIVLGKNSLCKRLLIMIFYRDSHDIQFSEEPIQFEAWENAPRMVLNCY